MPFLAPIAAAIGTAFSAVSGFVAAAGALGQAIVGIGLSVGLNALASLFTTKPKSQQDTGTQLSLQVGGDIPRQVIFGQYVTPGQLAMPPVTSGKSNNRLDAVYILSDGWCDSLQAVWIGGARVVLKPLSTVQTNVPRFEITGYEGVSEVRFFDGRSGQVADAALVANTGGVIGATDRFAGMCYVSITLTYDANIYSSGIPDFGWELKGYRCYDPRLDSTVGGSGAQRLDDPSTWVWSENPALHVYNFLAGIVGEGQLLLGPAIPSYDLIFDSFAAAANIAEEDVPLDAGGTEKRYRAAGLIQADDTDYRSLIAPWVQAIAGYLVEWQGAFGLLAGAAQVPVVSITDDDFRLGPEIRYSASKTRTERTNEVYGQFADPSVGYQGNSYPPITDATAQAEDGEPLRVSLDLTAVPSVTQAQRAARIRLRQTRRQKSLKNGTLGNHLLFLDPGDWIEWTSAKYGFTSLFMVVSRAINADDSLAPQLQEIGNEVFSWSTADELPVNVPGAGPGVPLLPTTVEDFVVEADVVTAADGSTRPVLRCGWTPMDDPKVDAVILEYRKTTEVAATRLRDDSPEDGAYTIDPIAAGDDYMARATIACTPIRPTTWTAWVGVTTGAQTLPPGLVDMQALAESVSDFFKPPITVRQLVAQQITDVVTTWDNEVTQHAESANSSATFTQKLALQATTNSALAARATVLEATVNDPILGNLAISASASDEETARATADTALATRTSALESSISDPTTGNIALQASLTTEAGTRATADTALSTRTTALESTVNNPTTGITATNAALATETTTRATADTALATRATALEVTVNNATTGVVATHAALSTEATARANGDTAVTTIADSAQATADGATATGQVGWTLTAAPAGVTAQYGVQLNSGSPGSPTWHTTGMYIQLASGVSRAVFDVDQFAIGKSSTLSFPFFVSGGIVYIDNAHIVNLDATNLSVGGVATASLAAGAVTAVVVAKATSSISVSTIATEYPLLSASRTTVGGPVLLAASVSSLSSAPAGSFRFYRDGTLLQDYPGSYSSSQTSSFNWSDSPAAGAHTYELRFFSDGWKGTIDDRILIATELKR